MGASTRKGVVAVGAMVAAAVLAVTVAAALAPDPEVIEQHRPDVALPDPDIAVPEPPVPAFAQGRLPNGGTWSASSRPGPDGPCIDVELTTASSGEGVGSCGRQAGIELVKIGPSDGWVVLAGSTTEGVVRLVLEGTEAVGRELGLMAVDGENGRVFASAVHQDEGYEKVVAYDEDGEVMDRRGIPRD